MLQQRVEALSNIYSSCELCPHRCKVNRNESSDGVCHSGNEPVIASYNAHFGEEPPISGKNGSGTIFFSGCTGTCMYCQNYPISQLSHGKRYTAANVADMMLELQARGCHNINFVTPTHFAPSIVTSVYKAAQRGLHIPIVYNTSGYERVEILKLLEGIIDIYLPDAKYADNEYAVSLSGFTSYPEINRHALVEMYRQVGKLVIKDGIAVRGMIIRHLILPNRYSGTEKIFKFIAEQISQDIHVSVMDQYFPAYKALSDPLMSSSITRKGYNEAIDMFHEYGLHNGWIQDHTHIDE